MSKETETIDDVLDGKTPSETPLKDKSVNDEPVNDESVNAESVKDESVKDESVKDESVNAESVKDESTMSIARGESREYRPRVDLTPVKAAVGGAVASGLAVTAVVALYMHYGPGSERVFDTQYIQTVATAVKAASFQEELESNRAYMIRFCDEAFKDVAYINFRGIRFTRDAFAQMLYTKCLAAANGNDFYGHQKLLKMRAPKYVMSGKGKRK